MSEGAGSVLDQCALMFVPEGGHGVQLNDATSMWQTHSVEDMVMLVAGRAGGVDARQAHQGHRRAPGARLISGMRAAGVTGDKLGEVTGTIPELFG